MQITTKKLIGGPGIKTNMKWDPKKLRTHLTCDMPGLVEALSEHEQQARWNRVIWEDHGLEVEAISLLFLAHDTEFTNRDKALMKLLYESPELRKDVKSLGEVTEWILEKRGWTDEDLITFIFEHGGQM